MLKLNQRVLRWLRARLGLERPLLKSKDGNGKWSCRDSDVRSPVPQDKKITSVGSWCHGLRDDTQTGCDDAVRMERPFQAMNGVLRPRRTGSLLVKRARNRKEAEKARFILGCDLFGSLLLW